MSAEDIDRVQKQLQEMQRIIEEERTRHAEESKAANQRIEMLEGRLQETNQAKLKKQIEERETTKSRVAARNTTTTTRTTTVRTSSANKRSNASETSSVAGSQQANSNGAAKQRFSSGASNGSSAAPRKSASPNAKSSNAAASPAPAQQQVTTPPGGFTTTALQHSWDKFCVKARGEFTVKELSLLSCDTLKLLMEYYSFRDPVEVAQVEAQWALLQEGRDTAYQATPHDGQSKRRSRSFSPVVHPQEFNIDIVESRKPHLSNRLSLAKDGAPRQGDPNNSCERHRTPSPGGKGNCYADPCTSSDPNNRNANRYRAKPGGKRSFPEHQQSRFEQKVYPRGKNRGYSPDPAQNGPYPTQSSPDNQDGKRRFNVQYSDDQKHRGVKIGYVPPSKDDPVRMKRNSAASHKTNIISLA